MRQDAKLIVLFDWNGTLLNDMLVWHKSINKVFEICGVKPIGVAEYFRELGENNGDYWPIYYKRGVCMKKEEMSAIYRAEYASHMNEIELSPGAVDALQKLEDVGITLGIITMQIPCLFEPLICRLDLRRFFGERIFTDITDKKTILQDIARREGVPARNCLYVGDSPSDTTHALNAGATAVAYLNDYIPQDLVLAAGPHHAIAHFNELPPLVEMLLKEE